ncbi:MAG: hypothetical protein HC836_48480 [Richelia sp. RM2_1_2]|nr:hypothetical protein [Richelia sp. RM2_1_2]
MRTFWRQANLAKVGYEFADNRSLSQKMQSDEKLTSLVIEKRKLLASNWSDDATKCLKNSLEELTDLVMDKESDSRRILAITNIVKVIGELKIALDVLGDD